MEAGPLRQSCAQQPAQPGLEGEAGVGVGGPWCLLSSSRTQWAGSPAAGPRRLIGSVCLTHKGPGNAGPVERESAPIGHHGNGTSWGCWELWAGTHASCAIWVRAYDGGGLTR